MKESEQDKIFYKIYFMLHINNNKTYGYYYQIWKIAQLYSKFAHDFKILGKNVLVEIIKINEDENEIHIINKNHSLILYKYFRYVQMNTIYDEQRNMKSGSIIYSFPGYDNINQIIYDDFAGEKYLRYNNYHIKLNYEKSSQERDQILELEYSLSKYWLNYDFEEINEIVKNFINIIQINGSMFLAYEQDLLTYCTIIWQKLSDIIKGKMFNNSKQSSDKSNKKLFDDWRSYDKKYNTDCFIKDCKILYDILKNITCDVKKFIIKIFKHFKVLKKLDTEPIYNNYTLILICVYKMTYDIELIKEETHCRL